MRRWSLVSLFWVSSLALPFVGACSADAGKPASSGSGGSSGSGTAGTAAAGTNGLGAAGSDAVGAAGATGSAGSATAGTTGAAGSASAGTTGAAGSATGTAGAGGVSAAGTAGATGTDEGSTMGVQTDPGTEGDGIEAQPPPYPLQPESTMQLNGAPKGQLLGPIVYTQKGTYTGWSMWKFTYWVYVPAQYKPKHAAAIMILQDGLKYNGDQDATPSRFNTPTVFDNLIHEGSMPVTIAVFIDPGTNDGHHVGGGDPGRARQYDTANDQYGKFLLNEFIPSEITSKYDIVTDADGWAMGGHSSGANASFIAAWHYPDRIHKVLAASSTFGNTGKFPGEFKTAPAKPLRLYHMAGSHDDPGVFPSNMEAANIFKTMGYHFRYRPGEDVHYPPSAAASDYPAALRWLWRNYTAGR